ncbi:hypothetical protein L6164_008845 [Bauhinia variegata]|uniref:Uncharacterized protein n=1 Tax=Bauhinia variegata TaxID=167791 RepID=A0ACB9PJF3_BAUVA|nr:hypothetical protein L6164_008845 [Bauhinia variegata]
MDRFIPNREAMDMDYARTVMSHMGELYFPPRNRYQRLLSTALGLDHSRILVFGERRFASVDPLRDEGFESLISSRRCQFPSEPEKILDAPNLLVDDAFHVLDWGNNDIIAVAFGDTLYGYDFNSKTSSKIVTVEGEVPITGVKWASDGERIAIRLYNGEVLLWDVSAERKLTAIGIGQGKSGSLAWNHSAMNTLTVGRDDGKIVDYNFGSNRIVASYGPSHRGGVLSFKWSPGGNRLLSGGADYTAYIWDRAKPSAFCTKFTDHQGAVRGLDWCPFEHGLVVSGGHDGFIKIWSSYTGKCLKSENTGSEVLSLMWAKCQDDELISSHGFPGNELAVWKYPSMENIVEFEHHRSRLLYIASSPDGCFLASASGESAPNAEDDKLMLWNMNCKVERSSTNHLFCNQDMSFLVITGGSQQTPVIQSSHRASLPPELLRDVIKRLEARAHRFLISTRFNALLCASPGEKCAKKSLAVLSSVERLLSFFLKAGYSDGPIQCFIKRDKSKLKYHLCLSPETYMPLIVFCYVKCCMTSNVVFP